ncbi:lysosomal acid lipase/cholesteryl ester hydrolase-like isoform X1 [Varroa jacobsoni]|uniref:lysosomal acid lipase/cholesteryl ester hydrolase-like isoform X1 n=1 Tax=Varroa jacobsoni TaxID=62625 RepID=UPI000BF6A8DC|nr:lysosomal acid lipase/cholesteryl ester hydrolase-like isoform X1 [Varroa jacobsoni]XP_022698631.1 lysosomal acid lipase/cholesteryl ester hydrolase-like isoform X1 [Varroa jacobsoni]XP_022698638.1 lysosomal acid lipase/cholesteryl ester hydrolase-like isoform X1 [Varroa jacobsoni]XP_022698646.1 lysosomal acid lipase/cholesteryl ester hydrolase-like isoform X1 [Varroa jacobsoni]
MMFRVMTIALVGGALATLLNDSPAHSIDELSLEDYDIENLTRFFFEGTGDYHDPLNSQYRLRDPDELLNCSQIIQRYGYPAENHLVQTKDGYILEIQRIPYGRYTSRLANGSRPVIYLQHGLLSSSFDFVANPPDESLGYILADQGFDVWLGNVRGNTYGRKHVNMTPSDMRFWDFSFDEFIAIDVPAVIDYILNKTGEQSLYYVGHSQGTTIMFGLLSIKPEYQDKIKAYVALAPVANVTTITSPVRWLAPFANDLSWILEWLGDGELLGNSKLIKFLASTLCTFSVSKGLCEDVIFLVCGIDTVELNVTRIPVYISHTPAGSSVKNIIHFAQEIRARRFQMYDYGASENQKRYNQTRPPQYDITKITKTPIAIYSSKNDWFADPADVNILRKKLPSLVHDYRVSEAKFTHIDFLYGVRANTLVYKDVLSFLASCKTVINSRHPVNSNSSCLPST